MLAIVRRPVDVHKPLAQWVSRLAPAPGTRRPTVLVLDSVIKPENVGALFRTLRHLPANDEGWLDSFLALDGMQALIDVLALSQQQQPPPPPPADAGGGAATPPPAGGAGAFTPEAAAASAAAPASAEAEQLQALCVGCLSLLVRRRAALEKLLSQPHAVTCVVAALELRGGAAALRIAEILLRVSLTPSGTRRLLEVRTDPNP